MAADIPDPPDRPDQRFMLVARAITDAIYDWEIASGHLWLSDSFYGNFGHVREALAPDIATWEALIHPEDTARVMAALDAAVRARDATWECEYRFRRGDGSDAWVLDRGSLLRDARGKALRMVGGMIDLTGQRQMAAELRLLRRAVEIIGDGIVITDAGQADAPIVYTNPAFARITGYAAAEALGRNCRFLQGEDVAQPGATALRTAIADGRDACVTLRNYRKDGELFWNEFSLTPMHGPDGRVTHHLGTLCDVTARHRFEEQLAYRATHDPLTGLPNRQLVLDRLGQLLPVAQWQAQRVAVLFVDLDNFKLVNDSLGHGAGDHVLRVVAERLSGLVGPGMTIGRYGGDEFVIVARGDAGSSVHLDLIESVGKVVAGTIEVEGIQHCITPSIGYCLFPEDGDSAEQLLMRADMAMYQAKREGRNRAIRYEAHFNAGVSQRLQLISRLRQALADKEFMLEFQPVFSREGLPVALEALVRWQHPERGLLQPAEFVGICEDSGLIVELGRRVLLEAARHHAMLADLGLGHLRMAVNVSAAQFAEDLHGDVADAIRQYDLAPHVLELELTESVIMASPERAIRTMRRLTDLGVGIAIDDFGTGYSSLAYLKQLPINRLKIDRTFVCTLEIDANDRSICSSIVAMARSLGLLTTAEGVETLEQLEWLAAHGVDEMQGYLMARPGSFADTVAAIEAMTSLPRRLGPAVA